MGDYTDRIVLTVCLLSVLGVGLSLLDQWFWFGVVNWLLITAGLGLGYGRQSRHKPVLLGLMAILLGYTLLFVALVWSHNPQGSLRLVLGFPAATALFIYGIWPFGVVASILYAVVFDRFVLSKDKLEKVLAELSRQREKA